MRYSRIRGNGCVSVIASAYREKFLFIYFVGRSVPPQETVKHWTHARWAESWASTTTRLHKFIPTPSNSGQGVGLSRRAWTRLNRLRTGVGRFGANVLRWGLSTNDSCECGAEKRQTTSPVDVAPSTDHLRGSMASLFWTMRREHGSRTMLWTYEWCVMAHARREDLFCFSNGLSFLRFKV